MQLGGGADVPAEPLEQRLEQPAGATDPVGKRRTIEVDAAARVDLALSVQRQVILVLRHQLGREQPRSREASRDRTGRCGGLYERLAAVARVLRPHVPVDL